jgi:hypothetical protein
MTALSELGQTSSGGFALQSVRLVLPGKSAGNGAPWYVTPGPSRPPASIYGHRRLTFSPIFPNKGAARRLLSRSETTEVPTI